MNQIILLFFFIDLIVLETHYDFQDIEFLPGEYQKIITVQIYDDEEPEPNEEFEVILASPKNGLRLGEPHKGRVFNFSLKNFNKI